MTSSDRSQHGPGSATDGAETASTPETGSAERPAPSQAPQKPIQAFDVPRDVAIGGEGFTPTQWTAALARVAQAVRNAQQASPDDYELAPTPEDDELRERSVAAMVAWFRDRHDNTSRPFNETGIREDLTGLADAMLAALQPELDSAAEAVRLRAALQRRRAEAARAFAALGWCWDASPDPGPTS